MCLHSTVVGVNGGHTAVQTTGGPRHHHSIINLRTHRTTGSSHVMEGNDMRIFGALFLLMMMISFTRVPPVQAFEEGQLVKKDGKWEYYAGEDPGLKYLYLKGIINEEEYNKGLKVLETKERISKPNFNIDVNNGLNIRVGEKFLLKVRLLAQARYSYSTFNDAWGTVGNSRNAEILGGQVEFRAFRRQSDSSQFTVPRV